MLLFIELNSHLTLYLQYIFLMLTHF